MKQNNLFDGQYLQYIYINKHVEQMQGITIIVPKQIRFTSIAGVQKLLLENPSPLKLAVKIRTNHKTALQIHPTHDFIEPQSKKDVIVKLLESHQGVKLQVNYCIATEEMVAKNDSKMANVDKKNIKKQIIVINVNDASIGSGDNESRLKQSQSSVENDFMSIVPQKRESKGIEKKLSLPEAKKQAQKLTVVEQKLEQDEQEQEEKQRKLVESIRELQKKIQLKREAILNKRQQCSQAIEQSSILPQYAIPVVLIAAYLLGSLIKSIIF